jgi:hypothetical protein
LCRLLLAWLPIWASISVPTTAQADRSIRFAVIGDYGHNTAAEAQVAALVAGWNPDFVITTGDNNYPDGEAATIDHHIGQYYSQFIGNYQGSYGEGSPVNRFWPSLGNHDWNSIQCNENGCHGPYQEYLTLPGNERYYDVDHGLVHLFAVDSDSREPDGFRPDSIQANWLQGRLAASEACFDVVFFHHPPYSSGHHGSYEGMRWPFAEWGAEVVMAGHDHTYERLDVGGLPYFVNGAGGQSLYRFSNVGTLPAGVTSIVRYNDSFGAMLVTATESGMTTRFFNAAGVLIDEYTLSKHCIVEPTATTVPTPTPTSAPTTTPLPLLTPAVQSTPTADVSAAGIAQTSTAVAIPQHPATDWTADLINRVTSWLSETWNNIASFWR